MDKMDKTNQDCAVKILQEMELKLVTMEKRLDTKVASLNKTIVIDFEKKVSSITEIVDGKILDIRQTISDFKVDIQEQINQIKIWQDMEGNGRTGTFKDSFLLHQNLKDINELVNSIRDYFTDMKTFMEQGKCYDILGFLSTDTQKSNKKGTERTRHSFSRDATGTGDDNRANSDITNIESTLVSPYINMKRPPCPSPLSLSGEFKASGNDIVPGASNIKHRNHNVDLLICMDSDRKNLQWRKMCTLQGTGRKFSGKLNELVDTVSDENKIGPLKHVLITVGLHDLENKSAKQVFHEIKDLVKEIRSRYKDIIMIVCEITPRNEKDTVVQKCNNFIHEHLGKLSYVYIMRPINVVQCPPPLPLQSTSSSTSSSYSGVGKDRLDNIAPD